MVVLIMNDDGKGLLVTKQILEGSDQSESKWLDEEEVKLVKKSTSSITHQALTWNPQWGKGREEIEIPEVISME